MKKFTATIVLSLFAIVYVSAQSPCLPDGITFTTQEEIDNFQVNYPGCTEIEGDVWIEGDEITNLEGLSVITSIGGSFGTQYVNSLTNLTGIENLSFVGGDLWLQGSSLTSLIGLENLTTIEGNLWIGIDLGSPNPSLTSLEGLEGLTTVGGGHIRINNNYVLTSLTGLENINAGTIEDIEITSNDLLGECDIQSICDYLVSPNGTFAIGDNAPGCSSIEEVEAGCNGVPISITFTTQEQIDSFQEDYPGLSSIQGDVQISGDITNLEGLDVIDSIGGSLVVNYTTSLVDLTGLENLAFIGFGLGVCANNALITLNGLESLASVNVLMIGYSHCGFNPNLISLSGLQNIDAGTIESIYITGNNQLSECHAQSICEYLASPNGTVTIQNNAPGCNSVEEVEEACDSQGIKNHSLQSLIIHPNPSNNGSITITLDNPYNLHLTCFNTFGQQIHQKEIRSAETTINVSTWSPGIYLAVVYGDGKPVGRAKFVVR